MHKRSIVAHSHKISHLEQTLFRIERNLDNICNQYRLITSEQKHVLLKDIKYMLLDNIAEEVKLVFYDPVRKINLLECLCTADGVTEISNIVDQHSDMERGIIVIDAFFKFTDGFLSESRETQRMMLCSTEFAWHGDNTNITI